jgi:hypothetical protein
LLSGELQIGELADQTLALFLVIGRRWLAGTLCPYPRPFERTQVSEVSVTLGNSGAAGVDRPVDVADGLGDHRLGLIQKSHGILLCSLPSIPARFASILIFAADHRWRCGTVRPMEFCQIRVADEPHFGSIRGRLPGPAHQSEAQRARRFHRPSQ